MSSWVNFPNLSVIKRTVSVILSDLPCKDSNVWFTTVPFKVLSGEVWIIYQCL